MIKFPYNLHSYCMRQCALSVGKLIDSVFSVLCSLVSKVLTCRKQQSTQGKRNNQLYVRVVFSLLVFCALMLPACFTMEQHTTNAFHLLNSYSVVLKMSKPGYFWIHFLTVIANNFTFLFTIKRFTKPFTLPLLKLLLLYLVYVKLLKQLMARIIIYLMVL